MKPPRGLSADEAEAWAALAATVTPLAGVKRGLRPAAAIPLATVNEKPDSRPTAKARPLISPKAATASTPTPAPGLDSHWERKIRGGALQPDFTLDLHGHTLDSAYARLMDGMGQARALDARVILLVAGKPRGASAADRGTSRGAIRAKVLDWLAASSHGPAIAAIRKAHIRHGGEGALYIVLKRGR